MRRFFGHLCILLSAVLLFASCIDDDKIEVTLYDDIAITAFGISSAKIYKHTTSSTGTDSVYSEMDATVKNYPFHIDHLRGEIYNTDSLPAGIDASKAFCTYSTKNSGIAYIENFMGDSVSILSTADTVDFSAPRYVRVYAMDNSSSRRYKITVNVHQENSGEFHWNRMADCADMTALNGMKAVTTGRRLIVFGTDGNSTKIYTTGITDGNIWTTENTVLGSEAWRNVALTGDKLYVLDGNVLYVSADGGRSFNRAGESIGISRLIGGSTTALYAIGTDGRIMFSADGGQTWEADIMADNMAWMPSEDINFCRTTFRFTPNTDYLLLTGNRSATEHPGDTHAVVWRKISEYAPDSKPGQWIYMNMDDTDKYPLPKMENITVFGYGNSLLALGGKEKDTEEGETLKNIYESRDGGITWKKSSEYPMPDGLDRNIATFAATTDTDNNIWIVCAGTGQVWRGRLNSMGWSK